MSNFAAILLSISITILGVSIESGLTNIAKAIMDRK